MHRRLHRPSPALVLASGALLLSLTGTGLADVAQLARNSVGTPQLRTGAVTAPKIRAQAVTTSKLRNSAVTLNKLARTARIPGPQGPAGPPGPQGPQGPAGSPANIGDGSITTAKLASAAVTEAKLANLAVTASKLVVNVTSSGSSVIAAGTAFTVTSSCGAGAKVLGGGLTWTPALNNAQSKEVHIVQSFPSSSTAWTVRGYNGTAGPLTMARYLVCAGTIS
jgi:hypothetical protein